MTSAAHDALGDGLRNADASAAAGMMPDLAARASELGLQPEYDGVGGERHRVPERTLEKLIAAFGPSSGLRPQTLAPPPGTCCYLPDRPKAWGVAVQLYQLRTDRNWGIGDFADLEELAHLLGAEGADFIGLNPVHAMFLADPTRCSPFSPSNRRFLNPLYIAVDRIEGFRPETAEGDAIARLRASDLVDYAGVAAAKLHALRAVWQAAGRPDASDDLRRRMGEDLDRHALFEAVSAHMVAGGRGAGWRAWPEAWQHAASPEVAAFAGDHAADIAFYRWLQDQADRQLSRAQQACATAGMSVGLYLDMAVGEAADGSGSWGARDVLAGVNIGAPPDYFNESGQDWGIAPLSPAAMESTRAAPFADLLDGVMRRAGAVRIDHAMGLWQLFLIPHGATPAEGAYARYPLDDMLRALAEASVRHRTLVVGEDLGNVPPGFREVMDAAGILSYRILFFERDGAAFLPPQDYPRNALACVSTHDLPTFQGWWRGDDIALRREHGLISHDAAARQAEARPAERAALLQAMTAAGVLDDGAATIAGEAAPPAVVAAAHRYLARCAARLMAARLEDLAGETRPVNLPSTTTEYPNWRRKLGLSLTDILHSATCREILAGIRAERPRAEAGDRTEA